MKISSALDEQLNHSQMFRKLKRLNVNGLSRYKPPTQSLIITVLLLAYPYLVYRGIESGMAWIAPGLFAALYLYQSIATSERNKKIAYAGISIALLLGAWSIQSITAKVMPVLIQLMLIYLFGSTLSKANAPCLIERFVLLEFPESPASILIYCRQLTIVWVTLFVCNALICIVLALWGSDRWWALFNGLIIYIMMAALMIGEYIYRHYRFPDLVIKDPSSSIKTMLKSGRHVWLN